MRGLTWVEVLEPPDPPTDAELLAERRRWLPHCGSCGRWVSPKTIRLRQTVAYLGEIEERAICKQCGEVPTSYPE